MGYALAVDWQTIRDCAIAGVSFRDLALRFGMVDEDGKPDTSAIRKRASRQQWPIPACVEERAKKMMLKAKLAQAAARANPDVTAIVTEPKGVSHVTSHESPEGGKRSVDAIGMAAESAVTLGERSRMAILAGLTPQVVEAMTDAQTFKPRNVKELVQVGAMIHKLSGLDQSGPTVSVNLWSDPARSNPALSGELYEVTDAQVVGESEE